MSLEKLKRAIRLKDFKPADRDWLPKWFQGYVEFHRLDLSCDRIPVTKDLLIAFLRSLRDRGSGLASFTGDEGR